MRRSNLQLHDGNRQAARASLQEALELDASNAEALMTLGQAYRDDRDYNRAELMFQRASAFDLYRENALISLAQLAIDQQDFERALTLLRDVVSRNPARTDLQRNVDTLENLVLASRRATDEASAMKRWLAAVALDRRARASGARGRSDARDRAAGARMAGAGDGAEPCGCGLRGSRHARCKCSPEGMPRWASEGLIFELAPLLAAEDYEAVLARVRLNSASSSCCSKRAISKAFSQRARPRPGLDSYWGRSRLFDWRC